MVLRSAIVLLALSAGWLLAGRRLTLLLDRFITIATMPLPVSPAQYDGGGFRISEIQLTFGALTNLRSALTITTHAMHRAIGTCAPESFFLVPRTNPIHPPERP